MPSPSPQVLVKLERKSRQWRKKSLTRMETLFLCPHHFGRGAILSNDKSSFFLLYFLSERLKKRSGVPNRRNLFFWRNNFIGHIANCTIINSPFFPKKTIKKTRCKLGNKPAVFLIKQSPCHEKNLIAFSAGAKTNTLHRRRVRKLFRPPLESVCKMQLLLTFASLLFFFLFFSFSICI